MVTLKEVETLLAVADTGSFMQASRRLGTTQSAISKIMAGMECKLGVQLFTRSSGGSKLTEEGEYVYICAREIEGLILQIREISSDLQSAEGSGKTKSRNIPKRNMCKNELT